MRSHLRSLLKPVVWTLALTTLAGCKPLDDTMVTIFGRSMRSQRSFDPYENTRPAPEHSVAFASGNDPAREFEVNIGEPEEGADIPPFTQNDLGVPGVGAPVIQGLVNPTDPNDPRGLARGQELYMRFCVVCHGPEGVGTGAYIAAFHPVLPTINLSGPQVAGYSDQYIYAMIRVGRGLMPEYGSRISHYDRWHVIAYVRQLQRQAGN
jgi:mono/diheme cytochrome c family protein